MDEKNPHYEETRWLQKVFWKGNIACGRDDNPDRVELKSGGSHWPSLDFKMPEQRYDLQRVEALVHRAYERGKADRSAEIGKMMKNLISI